MKYVVWILRNMVGIRWNTLIRIVVKEFFGQYFLEKDPDEGKEELTVDN